MPSSKRTQTYFRQCTVQSLGPKQDILQWIMQYLSWEARFEVCKPITHHRVTALCSVHSLAVIFSGVEGHYFVYWSARSGQISEHAINEEQQQPEGLLTGVEIRIHSGTSIDTSKAHTHTHTHTHTHLNTENTHTQKPKHRKHKHTHTHTHTHTHLNT